MRRFLLPLLLIAAACGTHSGSRPADIEKPDIRIRQAGSVFFGSSDSAPVTIDLAITNNARIPLRVREIELRSPGMMQYTLIRTSKIFNETIPPGEAIVLGMVVTVISSNPQRPSGEPLAVQAIVRFDANGRGFREVVLENFAGTGTS